MALVELKNGLIFEEAELDRIWEVKGRPLCKPDIYTQLVNAETADKATTYFADQVRALRIDPIIYIESCVNGRELVK